MPIKYTNRPHSIKSLVDDFLNSPDSDGMDVFLGLIRGIPNKFPLQYGKPLFDLIKAIIPAGLIPIPGFRERYRVYLLGEQIRDTFWPWYGGGTPPSILGFLYINFHFVGIIIGMLIFGYFAKIVYCYLINNIHNNGVIFIYGLTLFGFITGMVRGGDFVHMAHRYIIQLAFALISLRLITRGWCSRRPVA
jgi:oligosaccharide repeat unit polymerase